MPTTRVGSRSGAATSIDFEILREFNRNELPLPGVDPRRSPETIAAQLKVSPATVRRRLRDWRRRGFFLGYDVLPHPGFFGGRLSARVLDFPDPIAQENAIGPLSLIDGVVQICPSQNKLLVAYFVESSTQGERRRSQFQAVGGTTNIGPEMTFGLPPCARRMTRADWRLILALRRTPEAKVAELAQEVGQSQKTTSRRLDRLLEEGAILFDPIFDVSRFPQTLAILVVEVDRSGSPEHTESEIRALHPDAVRSWGAEPPSTSAGVGNVQLLVSAPAVAELDELTARVAHLPGVRQAFLWHNRLTLPVPDWLNERIEALMGASRAGA